MPIVMGEFQSTEGSDYINVGSTGLVDADWYIFGQGGEDTIIGAALGNDVLLGNQGNDVLYGLRGNDTLWGGFGNDSLIGGEGGDRIAANEGDDLGWGNQGDDDMSGYQGNDTLWGGQGNDMVRGNQDQDLLFGNEGNDVIYGGFGDDTIRGGPGADTMYGNEGADRFVLGPGDLDGSRDRVMDYSGAAGDKIDVSGLDFRLVIEEAFNYSLFLTDRATGATGLVTIYTDAPLQASDIIQ